MITNTVIFDGIQYNPGDKLPDLVFHRNGTDADGYVSLKAKESDNNG